MRRPVGYILSQVAHLPRRRGALGDAASFVWGFVFCALVAVALRIVAHVHAILHSTGWGV